VYDLSGSGRINPLGIELVTGTIEHNIAVRPSDRGTIALSSAPGARVQGTLTLSLVGAKGSLFGRDGGEQFDYTMSGTGGYASYTGDGTVDVAFTTSPDGHTLEFKMVFNPSSST
jgi:hypothetical protein